MDRKRGKITLTLVYERESESPSVRRRAFVMFKLFIKSKIQVQIEEYLEWKARFSTSSAVSQEEILKKFLSQFKHIDISEITLDEIQAFFNQETTNFTKARSMQALRGFMGYFWANKLHNINPKQITDLGIVKLPPVAKYAKIEPMIKRKVGRPPNVPFIKEVKKLKDQGGLGFRAIARAKNCNPGSVFRAYNNKSVA